MPSLSLYLFFLTGLSQQVSAGKCKCTASGCSYTSVGTDMTSQAACTVYCVEKCGSSATAEYSEADCLGGDTMLYSCTKNQYVAARDAVVGDAVSTVVENRVGTGHDRVCSEVYHVYHHHHGGDDDSQFAGIALEMDDQERTTVVVSPNHLVYLGDTFTNRRPVRASKVIPGDELVSVHVGGGEDDDDNNTTDAMIKSKIVRAVRTTKTDLVNILTNEPALEVQGGIVISAYSYHDTAYHYLFAMPLLFWNTWLGGGKNAQDDDSFLLKSALEFGQKWIVPIMTSSIPSYHYKPYNVF